MDIKQLTAEKLSAVQSEKYNKQVRVAELTNNKAEADRLKTLLLDIECEIEYYNEIMNILRKTVTREGFKKPEVPKTIGQLKIDEENAGGDFKRIEEAHKKMPFSFKPITKGEQESKPTAKKKKEVKKKKK